MQNESSSQTSLNFLALFIFQFSYLSHLLDTYLSRYKRNQPLKNNTRDTYVNTKYLIFV